jgi:hypothetical protein
LHRYISALTILELNSNRLTALPPEIGQLASLRKLRLDDNRLTEVGLCTSWSTVEPISLKAPGLVSVSTP